jgi:hypothetical protein
MENLVIEEGILRAVKDQSDFGGDNMWHLFIKTTNGGYQQIQWMGLSNIQELFQTKLPVFKK